MRVLIAPAIAILALLAVVVALPAADESAASGSISQLYIDLDITGNTVTHIDTDGDTNLDAESVALGPVDECAEIAVGQTITLDIVAADWPGGINFVGFEAQLIFDTAVVEDDPSTAPTFPVLGGDPQRFTTPVNFSDLTGNYLAGFMPFLENEDEDIDGEASSHGPYARAILKGKAVGQTMISLTTLGGAFVITHTEDGRYVPVDEVRNAFISVGQPCVPGAQPGTVPDPPGPPQCAPGLPDADGDGYSNCAELYMGTEWNDPCVAAPSNPFISGWPLDYTDNGAVNISDIIDWGKDYRSHLPRWDLDTDGVGTLLDSLPIWDAFPSTCVNTPPIPCASPPWWSHPPPWSLPASDVDCDGYASADEGTIGTNPDEDCGFTAGGATASDTWPPDLVESNGINISDVLALKPVFGGAVPPTSARFDLVVSGGINISDVLALKPFFGDSCPP